mgnify:FL=1
MFSYVLPVFGADTISGVGATARGVAMTGARGLIEFQRAEIVG